MNARQQQVAKTKLYNAIKKRCEHKKKYRYEPSGLPLLRVLVECGTSRQKIAALQIRVGHVRGFFQKSFFEHLTQGMGSVAL